VDELCSLLTNSGVEPPYVLVGHSLGGYYVRLYAHEHPDQVAGMVLVDTGHEGENLRLPAAYQQAKERFDRQSISALRVPRVLSAIGILARSPGSYPSGVLPALPPGTEETYKALLAIDSSFFDTATEEYATFEESTAYMRFAQLDTLGDIPLIVLTAGQIEVRETSGVSAEIAEETLAVQREIQAKLAALSPNGKQVIAEESGHLVQIDQPELVVEAISEVVGAAQR
jgi:pimeloyl-ACP methyl ester carboxylesterase